jgi:peptidoglycan/xylan/chitin deacetylase (PgdA/CDA1 family)
MAIEMMKNNIIEFFSSLSSKLQINKAFFNNKLSNVLTSNFIILNYHKTSYKAFMEHMQYLDKQYSIISYEEFYDDYSKNKYPGDPTFIITFDDGFNNFYTDIFPVCNEISIPAINFITTENVIHSIPFWVEVAREINSLGGKLNINELKTLTSKKRNEILDEMKKNYNYVPKKSEVLSEKQILELNKYEFISFGSHSVSHINLAVETEEVIFSQLLNFFIS